MNIINKNMNKVNTAIADKEGLKNKKVLLTVNFEAVSLLI
jgi:hypothetical protein